MQLPEDRLEVHALAGRYVLRHGLNGALAHKGLREPHRLVQRFVLDECAGEHAREHVAGAVKLLADERVEKKLRPAARAVKDALPISPLRSITPVSTTLRVPFRLRRSTTER